MRPRFFIPFFVVVFVTTKVGGQSFTDEIKKIGASKVYSIRSEGQLELIKTHTHRTVGMAHAKRVKYLSVDVTDDHQFSQLDLSIYLNLKFLFLGLEDKPPFYPNYNGRLHFDETVRFSGGIGFIPYLWPGGLSSDTNLLLIRIDRACAYSDCEGSVLLSLPSYLLCNKNLRWFDADALSVHYIPEQIDQCENLEVFALNHEGEMPFIPLNLFRCQRLSFLCLSEKNRNRTELVFLRQMHQNGKKIDIAGSYGSGDVDWEEIPYRLQSNIPLTEIKTTKKVEIHAADKKQLLISGQVTDGLLEGKWELWHPNGKQAQERYYFHGKETGVWRAWDSTGFLNAEYIFSDTGRTEISYRKYSSGEIWKNILAYNSLGIAEGKWIIEMTNSRNLMLAPEHSYLYIEQNYRNGQQQGTSYYKFEDGTGRAFLMKDGRVTEKKDF